jgi:NADH-quinone oxidoreductase subunit N
MILLILGVIRGNAGTRFISWGVTLAFAVAAFLLCGLNWDRTEIFGGMFVLDPFGGFMKLLLLGGLAVSTLLSISYLRQEKIARFEYPVLILFSGVGMMLMVSANNLLSMYVGLELQSLSLYVLAAFQRDHVKSAEAGIKYFVLGALASGMMLFGMSLVYGFVGNTGFDVIQSTLANLSGASSAGAIIGLVFILAGLAFKVSAVPLHMWTPDVYEGAPTSVTALFAIVPKTAAMALMMRLLLVPFGPAFLQWQAILWFLSAASMIVSAFAALVQTNIKRLMAYSSIGNMGYALIGLAAGGAAGANAVVIYLLIYMVMSAGTFGVILAMRRGGVAAEEISDLAGLSRTRPLMAYALAILMFSMSGIPPMAGFFGKLFIFNAAVAGGCYVLAVLGVLSSVVAAYYYLRIIKVMFFDEPAAAFDREESFTARRAIVGLSIAFVLLFICTPNVFVEGSSAAVKALFP